MSRKLATITKIKKTLPIEGADFIEAVTMTTNGWVCVAKKGDLTPGDFGVYFEIDSFLPKEERYAFLDGRSNKTMNDVEGYRLKTVKLRKQISQGLLLPLHYFPEITKPQEGDDVTELLKIELYEAPVKMSSRSGQFGQPAGKFPSFVRKTDQERIQSLNETQIQALEHKTYEITEKLDGTSATYYYNRKHFGVCSRNLELKTSFGKNFFQRCIEWFRKKVLWRQFKKQFGFPKSIYEEMAALHNLDKTLPEFCKETGHHYAIQGEIVGATISNNRLKLNDIEFYVFDIFDIDKQTYLDATERYAIAERLELRHVPIIEAEHVLRFDETPMEQMIKSADGKSVLSDQKREGLVYKQRGGEPWAVSFKIISNAYLLEHGI
jgi:RNA ligase (TIGR02306 family)